MPELLWVKADYLTPNHWNPNQMDKEMYAKAVASIHTFGIVDPVTVRDGPRVETTVLGGEESFIQTYEIIDGEHRWKAAIDEGLDTIPVFTLGDIGDDDARQLTIVLNETRGQSNPQKLGALLRDLNSRMSTETLLSTLPFSRDAFNRLTGMTHIDWSAVEPPRMPQRQAATWVERTYRMPVESAAVLDQALAKWHEAEDGGQQMTPDWQILEFLAADYLGT